jgi:V/A-type H+-transporting ATPase subunit I
MMFLCFTIGVSHLMLARIWNGVCKINSLDCLEEFGWAGVLFFMYFVVNAIVGSFEAVPTWTFWVFGVSLVMVVSRTRGVALGMLPLNVMGAMGDIISYVRLFAVGYASLQLAQNFNSMAMQFDLPVYVKIFPMVLILLVGHVVNLVLGALAILVHAVRLNTLEFSNHKGVTWSGYAFSPFKKN